MVNLKYKFMVDSDPNSISLLFFGALLEAEFKTRIASAAFGIKFKTRKARSETRTTASTGSLW